MSQIKGALAVMEGMMYEPDVIVDRDEDPVVTSTLVVGYNRLLKRVAHLEGAIRAAEQTLLVLYMEARAGEAIDKVRQGLEEALKEST